MTEEGIQKQEEETMEVFKLTLEQMLMMFSLIMVGFFLHKKRILPENAHVVLSKLQTYILIPALTLHTYINKCTVQTFTANSSLLLYGAVLVLAAIAVAYALAPLFVRKVRNGEEMYQRCLYRYAITFANFGFMGNFIILGLWGSDGFYQYSLFTFIIGLINQSWGVYTLIPKDQDVSLWSNLKKSLLAPPMLALGVGMVLGMLELKPYIPGFILSALETSSTCYGPVAMILAGFIIGGYQMKDLFSNRKVYALTALRLVVIPAAILLVLKALGTSSTILMMTLVAFATPMGLNTIVYPAAYGADTRTGASMSMVSHAFSIISIPLMYLFFVA